MRQHRRIIACLSLFMLLGSTTVVLHAARKKKKPSSPTAQAKRNLPAAKQAHADARLALYRAQYALSRVLQEVQKQADAERGKVDRTNFAAALEEHREAELHVERLISRTREKLSKENEAYIKAMADLETAQSHYDEVSNGNPPQPELILEALNAIKLPSKVVGDIEQAALAENDYFQKAVAREEETAARMEAERLALADQLNAGDVDDTTRQKIKDASAEVSKARLELAKTAAVLNRLSSILEPNNSITVGITKLNQNSKRKSKKGKGKGKGKGKNRK